MKKYAVLAAVLFFSLTNLSAADLITDIINIASKSKNPRSISDMEAVYWHNPEGKKYTDIDYSYFDSRVEKREDIKYYIRYIKPQTKTTYNSAKAQGPYFIEIEAWDKTPFNFEDADINQNFNITLKKTASPAKPGVANPEKYSIALTQKQLQKAYNNTKEEGVILITLDGEKGETYLNFPKFYIEFVLKDSGALKEKTAKEKKTTPAKEQPAAKKRELYSVRQAFDARPVDSRMPASYDHIVSTTEGICDVTLDLNRKVVQDTRGATMAKEITVREIRAADNECDSVDVTFDKFALNAQIRVRKGTDVANGKLIMNDSSVTPINKNSSLKLTVK